MDKIVLPINHVVCFHGIRTGHGFVGSFEGLVVIQRLCCTLYSRDVAESVVQRHGAAVPAASPNKWWSCHSGLRSSDRECIMFHLMAVGQRSNWKRYYQAQ
jgi:hypothetical protein